MIVGGTWLSTDAASLVKKRFSNAGTIPTVSAMRADKRALLVYPYWSNFKLANSVSEVTLK